MSETGHDFLYFSGLMLGCLYLFWWGSVESSQLFVFDMKMENWGGGGTTRGNQPGV